MADVLWVSILWFFGTFLGVLFTLGSSTIAMYKVLNQLLDRDKHVSIFQLFIKTYVRHLRLSLGISTLFVGNLIGVVLIWQQINTTGFGLGVVLFFVYVYEFILVITYGFGFYTLFTAPSHAIMLRNILIAMHKNLWVNVQLLSPVVLAGMIFFYGHPAFIFLTVPLTVQLQLIILKRNYMHYLTE